LWWLTSSEPRHGRGIVAVTHGAAPTSDFTLLDLATILVRHRRLVLGMPLAVGLLIAVVSLVMTPHFTATTTFVPEASSSSSRLPAGLAGLSGLAGQFGVSLGSDGSRSPRFYAGVLKSRELLERALLSNYADPRQSQGSDSARLLDILEIRGRSHADSLSLGVRVLSNQVATQVDVQTNIVRLSVESRYPELAAAVANRMIGYLNDFNAQQRQSQARARRTFVEQRIVSAEQELRAAEEDLRQFYERNRSWQQAPQLVFEEGRLRRRVDIRQEVHITLSREHETARIEEVNDAPVITVVDPAVAPQQRSRPRRTVMVLLALVLGGILGVFSALGADYLDRVRRTRGA